MKKILIIDDNKTNREMCRVYVKRIFENPNIDEVEDGLDGFDKIISDSPPDLVLVDNEMSNMCGPDMVQLLLSFNPKLLESTRIIGMSGTDISRFQDIGIPTLSKPFLMGDLESLFIKEGIV